MVLPADETLDAALDAAIVDVSKARFKVVFECATAIRTLAEVLSNMLETVEIHLVKSTDFAGIKIEAMDPHQISLVVSQLAAEVSLDCERTAFAVNTKVFHTCVRSAPAHYSISIESIPDSSSILIVAYESLSNASITRFTVPTLVCDQTPFRFRQIQCATLIDIETSDLKQIVSMAIKLQGELLTFKVQEPTPEAGSKRARSDQRHVVLTISSTGTCTQEHTFYSYMDEAEGTSCVAGKCDLVAQVPDGDLTTTYQEAFYARHLSDFLRSIDRQNVTLKLKSQQPLIIDHKFGSQESFVCLVIAPQAEEA